jgi:hypothetical protein
VLEFLAESIDKEKNEKDTIQKEWKLSLFGEDMFLYLKDPKDSTRKFLDLLKTFSKIARHKIGSFSMYQ